MGWPEDNVDFEHAPLVGDPLEIEDLALIQKHLEGRSSLDVRVVKGRLSSGKPPVRSRREKTPCETSVPKITHIQLDKSLPELMQQVAEINTRQEKLADGTMRALDAISRRVDQLERKPTPIWHLAAWQKSCLFVFALGAVGFTGLFAMSIVATVLGAR